MVEIKHLKGTRDYDPIKAELLFKIIEKARALFPLYGFEALDTSTLERWETLISKDVNAGEEIKEQTYNFKDRGGKHIGLRYDLTISLIRYVVENKALPMPFKRYQIGKVYRYEEAKRSRYREFYQLDLDVIGGKSFFYDAELLLLGNKLLRELGIKEHYILINNRRFTEQYLKNRLGVKNYIQDVMRTIDKIDKISEEEFLEEMKSKGAKADAETYKLLKETYPSVDEFQEAMGIKEKSLQELENCLHKLGVENYKFSMKIVRGLGYYTSNVFETFIKNHENIGSIASGGRYDNVFDKLLKMHIPCVGFSFGVDRIIDYLSKETRESKKDMLYICYTSKEILEEALKIRDKMINMGIKTLLSYDYKNLTNQIKNADKRNIKHIIIIGKEDLNHKVITYKNLETGEEKKIPLSSLKVLKDVVSRD